MVCAVPFLLILKRRAHIGAKKLSKNNENSTLHGSAENALYVIVFSSLLYSLLVHVLAFHKGVHHTTLVVYFIWLNHPEHQVLYIALTTALGRGILRNAWSGMRLIRM